VIRGSFVAQDLAKVVPGQIQDRIAGVPGGRYGYEKRPGPPPPNHAAEAGNEIENGASADQTPTRQ
jgi:hypothetical protein